MYSIRYLLLTVRTVVSNMLGMVKILDFEIRVVTYILNISINHVQLLFGLIMHLRFRLIEACTFLVLLVA